MAAPPPRSPGTVRVGIRLADDPPWTLRPVVDVRPHDQLDPDAWAGMADAVIQDTVAAVARSLDPDDVAVVVAYDDHARWERSVGAATPIVEAPTPRFRQRRRRRFGRR